MNKRTANLLYVVLIVCVILSLIFIIYYMITNKQAFIENPFIYGASKMGNVECSCKQSYGVSTEGNAYFWFNDTNINFGEMRVGI